MQKRLSLGEHVSQGNRLKDAHECLNSLICSLPRNSRASRQVRRALKAVDDLRCSLDSMICEDVPLERDPRNMAVKVYYGSARLESQIVPEEAFAHDAFARYRDTP